MNQILFQFAILLHPPKQNSVLVVLPTTILASNHQTVLIRAAKLIPNEYDDRLDQIEVLIRTYQPQHVKVKHLM
jgi:dUTPase